MVGEGMDTTDKYGAKGKGNDGEMDVETGCMAPLKAYIRPYV